MRKLLTYLAILAGIRLMVDGYDFMLAAPAVLISFGAVDLAEWMVGRRAQHRKGQINA